MCIVDAKSVYYLFVQNIIETKQELSPPKWVRIKNIKNINRKGERNTKVI